MILILSFLIALVMVGVAYLWACRNSIDR